MAKQTFKTRTARSKDDWITPPYFFDLLNQEFHFTLDPCAYHEIIMGMVVLDSRNAKCEKYYTMFEDGLKQDWSGEMAFVNPAFSEKIAWIRKCAFEGKKEGTGVVLIIPATPDLKIWHDVIMKEAHEIRFCVGRVNFVDPNHEKRTGATFPLAVIVWHKTTPKEKYPSYSSFYHKEFKKTYEN